MIFTLNSLFLVLKGGELEVLKSINWDHTRFDVLCIETEEANRPIGYTRRVIDYMAERGYHNRTEQQGRNNCTILFLIYLFIYLYFF